MKAISMARRAGVGLMAAGYLLGLGACANGRAAAQDGDATQSPQWAALRDKGPAASVALYPVRVLGRPDRTVAEALGLVLESQGMNNLDVAEAPFVAGPEASWEEAQRAFAAFVAQNPGGTEYALYAEYLGEPRSGPSEVRFVVANAAGEIVLSDRQTPKDRDFKRTAARDPDPMGCSVLVATRLFSRLDWKEQEVEEGKGKFAQLWAEKSGTPTEEERAAMQRRAAALKDHLSSARVTVFATLIGERTDLASAARLAGLLATKLGCEAAASDRPLTIHLAPSSNEQKRLWDLARALREQLRAAPCETEYALLAEYYIDPRNNSVHAVHFALCDRAGEWVVVDFQNNQWEDFQRIAPKNAADCDRLAIQRLQKHLQ